MTKSRTFDPIWEQKYSSGHMERYPWDSVVSFVFKNLPKDKPRSAIHLLEVGCGTGSNLWFAAREGLSVAGVDGSESAINAAKLRFKEEDLKGDFRVADFTSLPFEDDYFDLIIDRGALVCCGFSMGKLAISEIHRVMKKGARFLFNPYSDRHSSYSAGLLGPDGLVLDIAQGTMVGVGQICFYGRQQVESALKDFNIISLQHIECTEILDPGWMVHAEWRAVVEKVE